MEELAKRPGVSYFILWILLAVLLRAVAMLVALHGDVIYISYFPGKLAYEGILDIYRYMCVSSGGNTAVYPYYPPLTYLVLGGYQFLFRVIDPGFHQWIQEIVSNGMRQWLLTNEVSFDFFRHLVFMKLPYVVFDGLCFLGIWQYIDDYGQKIRALKLWSVNPVVLYGVYVFGQIDIMPASLVVLSVLMIKKNRQWWGLLLLSSSVLFKTFSVFLILPFLVLLTNTKKDLLKNVVPIILPVLMILLPFYISSRGYVMNSLFPKIFMDNSSELMWSYVQKMIFAIFYFFLVYVCFNLKRQREATKYFLYIAISIFMLVYSSIYFVSVHYFLWVLPLLVIAVSLKVIPSWIYYVQVFCLFVFNLNSPNTTTALLAPLNSRFFYSLQGVPDLMHNLSIRWGVVMLAARMIFTFMCVIMAMQLVGQISFFKRLPGWRCKNSKENLY